MGGLVATRRVLTRATTVEARVGAVVPFVVTVGVATLPTLALRDEHFGATRGVLALGCLGGGCRRSGSLTTTFGGG